MLGVHLSGIVAGISAVPAVLAILGRKVLPLPVELVLIHMAAAGFTVAVASTGPWANKTTWLLGKTQRGYIPLWSRILWWPYHLGLRTKLRTQRKVSTEDGWNQITPCYFLGAWPSEEALVPTVKPAVLDVTCELPLQVIPPAYLCLPVWDTHGPTPRLIEKGVQWAGEMRAAGRPVLVHCAHGHGRSATVLCAILMAEGQASSIDEAEALLMAKRPRVKLNERQRNALTKWLKKRDSLSKLVKQQ
ncbi:hypothetical protein N2152v2_007669 [Parachlorella kessleri]